jgi:hypothetical protein
VRPPRVGFVLMGCLRSPSRKLRERELPCLTPLPAPLLQHGELRLRVDNLYYLINLNVVKHLFKHTILEGLAKPKKELVRGYLKAADNYSYDAANLEEYPALRNLPDS